MSKEAVVKDVKCIKYIDLFCGLGAFHTAFNRCENKDIKYKCVFACDIDEGVRGVYAENYGVMPHGDINALVLDDIPDFDILCAGFPCQPFSIAGKQHGFNDAQKGNLFYSILNIVDHKQPEVLILENVKNLVSIHGGNTFHTIMHELTQRGYNVSHKVLDSRYYNCPQSRQRIFIVCSRTQSYTFTDVRNDIVPVSSVIDRSVNAFYDYTDKYDLIPCKSGSGMMKYTLINKTTGKGGRQGERVYGIDNCGVTICASSGGPGAKTGLYEIDGQIRRLTITETLQMFGFDTTYKYSSLMKRPNRMLFHLGNSIVVNVLVDIIEQMQQMQ